MFFVLSKVLTVLMRPGTIALALVVAGLALGETRRFARAGRRLAWTGTAILVLLAVYPWGSLLTGVLESRFPRVDPPADIAGIVVLGGSINPGMSRARNEISLNDSAERLVAAAEMAHRHPGVPVLFTGGSGSLHNQVDKEGPLAAEMLGRLGVDADRLIVESGSRNTWENATLSARLVDPAPGRPWVLVTSAVHMPRAVGVFRHAGWQVHPWPVDYATTAPPDGAFWRQLGFKLDGRLGSLGAPLHEWVGLAAYRLTGKTGTFFPAPAYPAATPQKERQP